MVIHFGGGAFGVGGGRVCSLTTFLPTQFEPEWGGGEGFGDGLSDVVYLGRGSRGRGTGWRGEGGGRGLVARLFLMINN